MRAQPNMTGSHDDNPYDGLADARFHEAYSTNDFIKNGLTDESS